MRLICSITSLLLQHAILVASFQPQPLLGPGYLPPTDFTSNNSLIAAAWSNFTNTLASYISRNQTLEGLLHNVGIYTFSAGVFSLYDASAARTLQYHHTAEDVETSDVGVSQVDGNSVYRVDSISKSFTVYLTLIEIGSQFWDCPITDFVSELAEYATKTSPDPLNVVDWKEVTLGALAGQIAGIPHDDSLLGGELSKSLPDPTAIGFPPIGNFEASNPCVNYTNASGVFCPEDLFLQTVTERSPVYLPWTTPAYTDLGYNLLALAVENITGKPFSAMIKTDMFQPLHLNSTYWSGDLPNLDHAVIPGGSTSPIVIAFSTTDSNAPASGGVYSTINDLAKYGTSILNSTLLCAEETRKWLKPITHTGSLNFSIGRPWEIVRVTQPATGRVTDLYTKQGSGVGSGAYLILSPDHGAGMSLLATGNVSGDLGNLNTIIADAFTSSVVPALEAQAAKESLDNFAGLYTSTSPGLNSSLKLAVHPSQGPGLMVTSWISNGTDMFDWLGSTLGDEVSLFPSDLVIPRPGQAQKLAFRATFGSSSFPEVGLFTQQFTVNGAWVSMDATFYGGVGIDLFVFDVDTTGKAVGVTPAALRATLKKMS